MKKQKKSSLGVFLPALLMAGLIGAPNGHAIDLNGNWGYTESDNGTDQTSTFNQRYGTHLSRELTSALSMNGSLSYNRNWAERSGTDETLQPHIGFSLNNDLFRANLSGYMVENYAANGYDRSDRSWDSTIGSAWQKKLVPSVTLQYGERVSESDIAIGSGTSRRDDSRYGANVDWDIIHGRINYGFSGMDSENSIDTSETRTANHFAKFSTAKSFFQDRVNINFSQQYNEGRQEYQANINPAGYALREKVVVQVNAAQDNTPLNTVMGGDIPAMRDSILTVAAPAAEIVLPPTEQVNIGFQVSAFDPEVDLIYLYTRDDLIALAVNPANVGFSLYIVPNPLFPAVWTQVTLPAGSVTYSSVHRRFAISIPRQSSEYVKLVVDATLLGAPIPVTEIEIFEKEYSPSVISTTKRHGTDVGVNYQVSDAVDLGYAFSHNDNTASGGSSSDQTSHSASLRYDPMTTWSTSFTVSESLATSTTTEKSRARAYSLGGAWSPLATLRFQSGLSRSEAYTAGSKTSTGHSFNINTIADLYRDLSSSVDLNYATSKSETSNETTDIYGADLRLTARLNPQLTVSLTERYSVTASSSAPTTDGDNTDVNLSWRPSDILSFSSSASYARMDNSVDATAFNFSVHLIPATKTQLGFTYGARHATYFSENYSVNWNWLLSRNLSFLTYGRFDTSDAVGSDDAWSIGVQLSARASDF